MRIILIDLGGGACDELVRLLAKHQAEVVSARAMPAITPEIGGIVVVGASDAEIDPSLANEIVARLSGLDKPLVGIGQGFNTICKLQGVDLESIFDKAAAGGKLIPTDDGAKVFQGTDPLLIKATPRWLIDELPKGLQVLARSESGIEAIRHKQKPIVAIQQQFDDFIYPSDGSLVFGNIFSLFGRV